jgi:tRNA dimethylallyltransferase
VAYFVLLMSFFETNDTKNFKSMTSKKLIVIVGPTAIGKTETAILLAQQYNAAIFSADSRQFFKEMNIGTAKPTQSELDQAQHYFIDNLSIHDYYSTGDYERDVIAALDKYFITNDIAILCGGSGLYVTAVVDGIDEFPTIAPEIRQQVIELYQTDGIEALQTILLREDPEHYHNMDINNKQRLMRAVEICLGTGTKYSSYLIGKKLHRNFDTIKIGLELDRKQIYDRINKRVDTMIDAGLEQEAKQLFPHKGINALQTVGYQEFFSFFEGEYDLNTAVELIKRNTRRFAKKQLTWFKKDTDTTWFSPFNISEIQFHIAQNMSNKSADEV